MIEIEDSFNITGRGVVVTFKRALIGRQKYLYRQKIFIDRPDGTTIETYIAGIESGGGPYLAFQVGLKNKEDAPSGSIIRFPASPSKYLDYDYFDQNPRIVE